MKYFAPLLLQICWMASAFASDQEGYILKTGTDTVWGKVDVETKKVVFGKKELDLGEMEQAITFTENGGRSKKIKASEIAGYGFKFSDVWYHFVVLDWQKNIWKKSQNAFERKVSKLTLFIHRAYDGAVPLYKDYYKATGNTMGIPGSKTESIVTELYIFTTDLGFVEVAPPNFGANKKLKEFLMKYLTIEEEFIKTVDNKAKFTDAEEVLKTYNEWKNRN